MGIYKGIMKSEDKGSLDILKSWLQGDSAKECIRVRNRQAEFRDDLSAWCTTEEDIYIEMKRYFAEGGHDMAREAAHLLGESDGKYNIYWHIANAGAALDHSDALSVFEENRIIQDSLNHVFENTPPHIDNQDFSADDVEYINRIIEKLVHRCESSAFYQSLELAKRYRRFLKIKPSSISH